jgi:NAD(P)H-dependent FMN reductase
MMKESVMSETISINAIKDGPLVNVRQTRFSDENREASEKDAKLKILAFAATNSRDSINKAVISYAAKLLADEEVEIIDLNEYEMPLYSIDREREIGIPEAARRFYEKIGDADALLISFAEHNGFYTAAYKNLFDWASRIDKKVYQGKPAVLLATSPGPGGARRVLQVAKESAPIFGMDVQADLSIPRFYENFDMEYNLINDSEIKGQLELALARLN